MLHGSVEVGSGSMQRTKVAGSSANSALCQELPHAPQQNGRTLVARLYKALDGSEHHMDAVFVFARLHGCAVGAE
jgi:hypothetical protein